MDQLLLWSIVTAVFLLTSVIATLIRRSRFKTLLPQAATHIPPPNSVVWYPHARPTRDLIIAAVPMITAPELLAPDSSGRGFIAVPERFVGEQLAYHEAIAGGDSVMMPDVTARQALENPPDISVIGDASVLASVAVGGFLGMSVGQFLGGTVFNRRDRAALVGLLALGGAILGRIVSTRVKVKLFRVAVETYETARASALRDVENQRRIAQEAIKRFVEDRDKALGDAINQERGKFLAVARDGRRSAGNERHLACKAFASHLGAIHERIWTGFHDFREMHQSSIFTRWLYPKKGDVAVDLAGRWARAASTRVEQLRIFLLALLSSSDENKWEEAARVISQFIRTFECDADRYYGEIKANADRLAAIQQIIEKQAEVLDDRLRWLLADAQREVDAFADATDVRLRERLRDAVKPAFKALERVRSEGSKLGKTIP